jgi:hypothetical protein
MCLVTVTGQLEERLGGAFLLAVTTTHQGDEWTTPQTQLEATNWDEAHAEAQALLARYRTAIRGRAEKEQNHGPTQAHTACRAAHA